MMQWGRVVVRSLASAVIGITASSRVRSLIAVFRTRDHFTRYVRDAEELGFTEQQITVREGTIVNVAEKAGMGIPLLMIPGQGSVWQEYCKTLPQLTATFHVMVVDVHGHGKSSWNLEDYTCDRIARDLIAVADRVFGEPFVIAGHSSGGLIAARMAALYPDRVRGILFEDSPFFSTEPERVAHTYVGIDSYPHVATFLAQDVERDWVCWYMPRSYWRRLFGPAWPVFTRSVIRQRGADPERLPVIRWVPMAINRIWESISHPFDLRFTAAIITQTWFRDFDQAGTLRSVRCPSTFLKATTRHDRKGNLLAALDDSDLGRVEQLLPDNRTVRLRSSHDIHFAHTAAYVAALEELAARVA